MKVWPIAGEGADNETCAFHQDNPDVPRPGCTCTGERWRPRRALLVQMVPITPEEDGLAEDKDDSNARH